MSLRRVTAKNCSVGSVHADAVATVISTASSGQERRRFTHRPEIVPLSASTSAEDRVTGRTVLLPLQP